MHICVPVLHVLMGACEQKCESVSASSQKNPEGYKVLAYVHEKKCWSYTDMKESMA